MAPLLPPARGFPTTQEIKAKPDPIRVQKDKAKKPKNASVILTLDLSTSCIGWAVGREPQIVNYGKLVFTDDRPFGARMVAMCQYLRVIMETYKPTRIVAEKPLARRGNVTASHNQILGIVRLLAVQILDLEIPERNLISPRTVKSTLGVKAGKDHDQNKAIMVRHVNRVLGLNLKYHKHSKLQTDDDTADAIALLLHLWA